MPKDETRNTFYWISWKVNTVGNALRPVFVILQKKWIYLKTIYKKCGSKTSSTKVFLKEECLLQCTDCLPS